MLNAKNTNKSIFLPSRKLTMLRSLNNISLPVINFEQEYLINQSQSKHNLPLVKSDHHFPSLGNSTIPITTGTSYTTMTSEYVYFATSAITISSYQKLDCTYQWNDQCHTTEESS